MTMTISEFIGIFVASLAIFVFGYLAGYKASEVKIAELVAFVCRGEAK